MTRRVKVALYGSPQKFAIIDLDAMQPVLGQNIYWNGRVLDPREVLNDYVSRGTTVVAGSRGGTIIRPPVSSGPRTTDDLDEGRYNLYFTNLRAQNAVGLILTDTADIDLTYDSGAHTISAELTPTGVTPGTYGDATHVARVTCDANGRITSIEEVEVTGGGGAGVWGSIAGDLSDQTDLQDALDDKADRDADQTFRTRTGNTGGGDIYTRNVWHGPVAYHWWTDSSGTRIFGSGPDSDPAMAWCFFLGASPSGFGSDPLAIDLSTGEVGAPLLTSTTQAPADNSTKVATTEYVDSAVANAEAGDGPKTITCTFVRTFGRIQPGDYATLDSAPAKAITAWRITSKQNGSISVDVRAASWPTRPTAGDSIVGNSAYEIKLTSADHNDGVTSSWSTDALTAGQRVEFYVTSATGISDIAIQLELA